MFGFPVVHYNPPSRCSLNDFYVTGIIHCNNQDENRSNIENRTIFHPEPDLSSDTKVDVISPA